ncbi:MAG: SpoIIIAH-like family protein [Coprobacillus sp.]|nr:SpoIIIAH-like family protein [Coprobacillus sp.]MCI9093208.1 SpoIIIAH-like family protein [Coprobacillus sp.]
MNKQAFTFLTLFSLILVLSVYYIMLPPTTQEETVTQTQTTIQQLQKQLDKKREDIISKNNQIIAKESSTSDSINEALETISETKNRSDKERNIVDKIKELGYQEVYVEIDNETVKITILKKDATQSDASKIIKEVLNLLGEEYQVEVKFISE